MRTDRITDNQWHSLVTELRGSQDERQHPWGDVDELLIARFLAGECDEQERAAVERARRTFPEVRECIALAGEALSDAGSPVSPTRNSEAAPRVDAGAASRKANRGAAGRQFWRLAFSGAVASWGAAACLLIAVGLTWVFMPRLNNLYSKVVALRTSREYSGGSAVGTATSAEATSPKAPGGENRTATAVRGFAGISRRIPFQVCKFVREEVVTDQGTQTVARPVFETGWREEKPVLPHDPLDNLPMLPPEELFPALNHGMELVRWAAADALSRSAAGELRTKARSAVIESLKKRDDLGRAAADYVLTGRIDEGFGSDLCNPAMEALDSSDKIVRWAGLHYFLVVWRCFGNEGPTVASPTAFEPEFVARLVRKLVEITRREGNPVPYKAAVYLLGQFGDGAKPAIDDLIQIVEGAPDPQVRRWAAYAIGRIGADAKRAAPHLSRILLARASIKDRTYDDVLFPAVAYAFGELCHGDRESKQAKETAPVLLECLADPNPNVSYWSAYALWRISEPALSFPLLEPQTFQPPSLSAGASDTGGGHATTDAKRPTAAPDRQPGRAKLVPVPPLHRH